MMIYRPPYPIEILSYSHIPTFHSYIDNLKQKSLSSDSLFQLFNSVDHFNNNCLHIAANSGNIHLLHDYIARVIELLGKEKGTFLIREQVKSRNQFGYLPYFQPLSNHPINSSLASLYNDPIKIISLSCNLFTLSSPHKIINNSKKEIKAPLPKDSKNEIKPAPMGVSFEDKIKPPFIFDRAMDSSYLGFRLSNSIFFFSNPTIRDERAESPGEEFNINEILSPRTP